MQMWDDLSPDVHPERYGSAECVVVACSFGATPHTAVCSEEGEDMPVHTSCAGWVPLPPNQLVPALETCLCGNQQERESKHTPSQQRKER